jgi:hypothetical protein
MWTYLETIGKGRRDVFDRDGGRLGVGSEGEASFDVWRGFAREDEGEGGRGCWWGEADLGQDNKATRGYEERSDRGGQIDESAMRDEAQTKLGKRRNKRIWGITRIWGESEYVWNEKRTCQRESAD